MIKESRDLSRRFEYLRFESFRVLLCPKAQGSKPNSKTQTQMIQINKQTNILILCVFLLMLIRLFLVLFTEGDIANMKLLLGVSSHPAKT